MRLGQVFRNIFHRGTPAGQANQARGQSGPTRAPATGTHTTPAQTAYTANAPAPQLGGRRPTDRPLPLPPQLQAREGSPDRHSQLTRGSSPRPPSYQSVDGVHGSPAPSFAQHPRPDEQRLAITDFGDRLGRPPSSVGSHPDRPFDQGSMNGLYPGSERSLAHMNVSTESLASSVNSSVRAQGSHQGHGLRPESPQEPRN
jgi:hypothetical protein